jgi:hypothetical protein
MPLRVPINYKIVGIDGVKDLAKGIHYFVATRLLFISFLLLIKPGEAVTLE